MKTDEARLASLLAFVQEGGRICPRPCVWNQLWKMLPDRQRVGGGWNPPLPLILAAWDTTTGLEKMLRLKIHIEYAAKIGGLDAVEVFLRALPESDWYRVHVPPEPNV